MAGIKIISTFASQTQKTRLQNCENSSVGRAQPCQGWGRGFESRFSLKEETIWALTVEDDKNVRVVELVDTLL